MNDHEREWSQMISAAIANAKNAGRSDIADYLTLRAANDTIRIAGIQWLFENLIGIAAEANRINAAVAIERVDPHSFDLRGARLTGSMLQIRLGVRCLTVEAGWTRSPADGFMRGGALAVAKLTHYGIPRSNVELLLIKGDGTPLWRQVADGKATLDFELEGLARHFTIFIGG